MSSHHSERRNVKIIAASAGTQQNPYLLSEEEERNTLRKQSENKQRLRVPRRPPWMKSMTTAQLDRQEKDSFLEWRRGLAEYVFSFVYHLCRADRHIPVCKIATNSSSHLLNATLKYGGNCGVFWSDRTSLFKLSMHEIHFDSDARI